MGLLKVDVLALGMLTAIRKSLNFVSMRRGFDFQMQDIPAEDPDTYEMICRADTVGVFQIESRAQMSMLPRLQPRCFYDLVIEVALVRPGPIQGGMVHPYLNRRQGKEAVVYPSAALEEALGRTLGVPVFQEQVMQVSILAAGFTPGEADGLRRAMAAWKRKGGLEKYYDRIVNGMTERGYDKAFALQIFEQIKGFSEYGFPESHASSFALLVYASCWLKHAEPAAFLAAMLNSQPLGFYSPNQLVQDAKRHGVEVRSVDVMFSEVDATLEDLPHEPAVRLGMRLISGLKSTSAERIVAARERHPFESAEDLSRRANLEQYEMKLLAGADALASLSGHRRQQVWDAAALHAPPELLRDAPVEEDILALPEAPEGEEIVFDYSALGLTLRRHPLALLRSRLAAMRFKSSAQLRDLRDGSLVRACGIVTLRQQPETAKGVIFVSLEDEDGSVQVIVWKSLREKQRQELMNAKLLGVYGVWQREGEARNLIAKHFVDLTHLLGRLVAPSRDFH
jgi:error-prone DNA polymerase